MHYGKATAHCRDGGRMTTAAATDLTTLRGSILLQPIIDLESDRVSGWEALSRFTDDVGVEKPSHAVFNAAVHAGVGVAFELQAVRSALALFKSLPTGTYLSLNVSVRTLTSPQLLSDLGTAVEAGVRPARLVIEITQGAPVHNVQAAVDAREALWQRGIRLAIDDFGGGHAGLVHAITLRPDIVKLDRTLVDGVAKAPERARFLTGMISGLPHGAVVVAKGVESPEDLAAMRMAGVSHAQGYYLGVPGIDPVRRPSATLSADWSAAIGKRSVR